MLVRNVIFSSIPENIPLLFPRFPGNVHVNSGECPLGLRGMLFFLTFQGVSTWIPKNVQSNMHEYCSECHFLAYNSVKKVLVFRKV